MTNEQSPELQFEIDQAIREAHCLVPDMREWALIGTALWAPNPNDIDVLVLVPESYDMHVATNTLLLQGFEMCSKYDAHSNAQTTDVLIVRRDRLNLIITRDAQHFDNFRRAMEVCAALRLERKVDRVTVCKIVRDGYDAREARSAAEAACCPSETIL